MRCVNYSRAGLVPTVAKQSSFEDACEKQQKHHGLTFKWVCPIAVSVWLGDEMRFFFLAKNWNKMEQKPSQTINFNCVWAFVRMRLRMKAVIKCVELSGWNESQLMVGMCIWWILFILAPQTFRLMCANAKCSQAITARKPIASKTLVFPFG